MILDPLHNPLTFVQDSTEHPVLDEDQFFNSFVDPMMLLPSTTTMSYSDAHGFPGRSELFNDFATTPQTPNPAMRSPNLRSSTAIAAAAAKPGSLYNRLKTATDPMSPLMVPSPFMSPPAFLNGLPGSPPALNMCHDPSWMHSSRPRRRRSNYASPTLASWSLSQQAAPSPSQFSMGLSPHVPMMSPSSDPWASALAFSSQNYSQPYYLPPTMHPYAALHPPRTPKFPMAPNYSGLASSTPASQSDHGLATKIPLVLPFHMHNAAPPPGIDSEQSILSVYSSRAGSLAPSRCSSIAPSSSASCISQRSSLSLASSTNRCQNSWFAEMSVTKDLFLKEVAKLDFTNVTVLELKTILRKFGLNSTGKKTQLAERINEIATYLKSNSKSTKKPRSEQPSEHQDAFSAILSATSSNPIPASSE